MRALHMDRIGEPGRCEDCGDRLEVVDVDLPFDGNPKVFYGDCVACQAEGEPCERCGERGTLNNGNPQECRSASCASSRANAAEYLVRE